MTAAPPTHAPAALGSPCSVAPATPILFADHGCPFAHRVLALLAHLGTPVERRESSIGAKPEGLDRYSSSKRIPLLVHGSLVLTESRVIIEHLADYHAFADAYPAELDARSLHRHAMVWMDRVIVPLLFGRAHAAGDEAPLDDALTAVALATATHPPTPCLLALHVAPMWLRFRWSQPTGAVTRAVEARAALCNWLDATIELACVTRTAPDPVSHLQDLARAQLHRESRTS